MSYKPFLNEETRSSVLSGVRSGSEAAWGRFFDLYAGYVFSLANQAGLIGPDADDIVQTVFAELSAPGGFDGYERDKGAFRPWLRRRVLWRITDEFRRRAARPPFDDACKGNLDALVAEPETVRDELWRAAAREVALCDFPGECDRGNPDGRRHGALQRHARQPLSDSKAHEGGFQETLRSRPRRP